MGGCHLVLATFCVLCTCVAVFAAVLAVACWWDARRRA